MVKVKTAVQENFDNLRSQTIEILKSELSRITLDQIKTLEEIIYNKSVKIINEEEDSLFNENDYTKFVVKIITNLSSDYVLKKIRDGTWTLDNLVDLERESLNPQKWQELQDKRLPAKVKKERVKGPQKCGRCKSWYTTFRQAQTRSADEGLTTYGYCEDCEHHWKF